MSLDSVVNVSITRSTKNPTKKGFGTPMLLTSKVPAGWGSARSKTFGNNLTELTDAGFLVTDPVYLMAQVFLSQNPTVKQLKIGTRLLPPTKSITLTVSNHTEGYVYDFTVAGTAIHYVVLAGASNITVATALAALIDAITSPAITASSGGTAIITIAAPAGVIFDLTGWRGVLRDSGLTIADATTDPGIATDLANIKAYDDDWYGLVIDSAGKLEQAAIAAWVEANGKICAIDACDSEIIDPGDTDDAASAAKGFSYARTGWWVSTESLLHRTSCGIMGAQLTQPPGSDTWAFKTLVGVAPSNLTTGEETAVLNKHANVYVTESGLNLTHNGTVAVGEYYDVIRGVDWLKTEIQTAVFAQLANAPKVPFTDAGVDSVVATVSSRLMAATKKPNTLLSPNPAPFVEAPKVADVSTANKAARLLPDITFGGILQGAIHAVEIRGNVSL